MMKAWWCLTVVLAAGPQEAPSAPLPSPGEALSGGATTVFDTTLNAFGRALGNMESARWRTLHEGKALFVRDWSASPDALAGPLTNAQACNSCHFKDGRGRPYDSLGPEAPLLSAWGCSRPFPRRISSPGRIRRTPTAMASRGARALQAAGACGPGSTRGIPPLALIVRVRPPRAGFHLVVTPVAALCRHKRPPLTPSR